MIKKPSVTPAQLIFLSVGSALIFPFTFMPILSTPPANQDAWVVLLMMFPYVLVISLPVLILANRFKGMTLNEMLECVLGKALGKAASLIFALFFLFCLTACSLITLKFLTLYIFMDTPPWALLLYLLVPVCYASLKGIGTIARLPFFIVTLMIVVSVLFFLMSIDQMDLNNLRPMLADSTFIELNQGAFLNSARYSEILILFVFSCFLKDKAKINKIFAFSMVVFGIVFLIILLPTLLVLGSDIAKRAWNPYWLFSKQVESYDFIQRMQSLNLLTWFPGAILKLIIYNYMGSYTLSNAFNTKSHRTFVIPLALIAFIACQIPVINRSDVNELLRSDQVFPYIVLPVTFVLPLIILIVYLIRRKKIDAVVKRIQMAAAAETEAGQNAEVKPT